MAEHATNVFTIRRDRRGPSLDWSRLGLCPDCGMPPGLPCRDLRYCTGAHYTAEPHPGRTPVTREDT